MLHQLKGSEEREAVGVGVLIVGEILVVVVLFF